MHLRSHESRGFTLLELIIAASLFAVAATAVYTTFHSGMLAWRRVRAVEGGQWQWRSALRQVEDDLHNAAPYRLQRFTGESQQVEFATIRHGFEPPLGLIPRVAVVSYRIERDPREREAWRLLRREWLMGTNQEPEELPIAHGFSALTLRYARPSDEPGQPPVWLEEWAPRPEDPFQVPVGVQVALGWGPDPAEGAPDSLIQVIEIPIGSQRLPE